jgi:glycosyltransferase involved in cell wall biosynthesis
VAIATPSRDRSLQADTHDGLQVFRFESDVSSDDVDLAIDRPEPAGWCDVLDAFAPTVVDLHALATSLELRHLKAAQRRGARTVTTLHLPGTLCARGTFMRFGTVPCPGNLERQPCTACRLEARGVPIALGRLIARMPHSMGTRLNTAILPGSLRSIFTARLKDEGRRAWFDQVVRHSDRVVAQSTWLADALMNNSVPVEKITLCRQGVDVGRIVRATRPRTDGPLRVGFVGRFDAVKGLHVLIDALDQVPSAVPLELHVWGVARSTTEVAYRDGLMPRLHRDKRIVLHDEARDAGQIYHQLDALAVPSLWLETGPLVVLEAQAAGLPVVGSNLGGIAERIVDGENGLLVPSGQPVALARVLETLATDPKLLERLSPKHAPRTLADVAGETLRTYATLLSAQAA